MRTINRINKTTSILLGIGLWAGLSLAQGMDLDGNGLGDRWELLHFEETGIDASLDHDGDGQNALQEMLAQTDPNDATSCFIESIDSTSDSVAVNLAPLSTNRAYALERAEDLASGSWQLLTNGMQEQLGTSASVIDENASNTSCYYRVSITPSSASYTGRIFYASAEGDDSNDGLSIDTPWKTLSRIQSEDFIPGDTVLLRRGDTWRESLYIDDVGTEDGWITYGAYGAGNKPKILGSESASNWVEVADNIWQASGSFNNPVQDAFSRSEVFFEELSGENSWGSVQDYDDYFISMTQEGDWCWSDNKIYVYAPSDPGTRYQAVEVPQRDTAVSYIGSTDTPEEYPHYIALDNLAVKYTKRRGIYSGYNEIPVSGLRITYCEIGCIGYKGGSSAYGLALWVSEALIQNNVIHNCGRRAIAYTVYDTGTTPEIEVHDVTIDNNYFYNGYHSSIEISTVQGVPATYRNFFISNNLIDDSDIDDYGEDTNNSIYMNASDATHTNICVFNNVIINTTGHSINCKNTTDLHVYNNSIYGLNPNAGPFGMVVFEDVASVDFQNNIMYSTLVDPEIDARCFLDKGSTYAVRDHNLYYMLDSSQPFTGSDTQTGDYKWDVYVDDWDDWRATLGVEQSSPTPQNPLFRDAVNGNLHLLQGSPAIDAGAIIPGYTDDYNGSAPDMGAFESLFTSDDVDEEVPDSPLGLAAEALSSSQIQISWDAASDNVAVEGYTIYRNGSPIGYTTAILYIDTGLTADTEYAYSVQATDPSDNASIVSDTVEVSTLAAGTWPDETTITTSSYRNEDGLVCYPSLLNDGDLSTFWCATGINDWIQFVYPEEQYFNTLSIAFLHGEGRVYSFAIQSSDDGTTWTTLLSDESTGLSDDAELFTFAVTESRFFRVVGTDVDGGREAEYFSVTEMEWSYIEPDVEAPTTPLNITASTNSSFSATISWSASSDNRGVEGYNIYRDGVLIGESVVCTFDDESLNAESTYSFTVAAFDATGNMSAQSEAVSITTGELPDSITYYVSNDGYDSNDGLTEATAWQTIDHVNDQSFNPGDTVLFQRDDTWRETLTLNSSGVESAYITYGAYGTGDAPEIFGSNLADNWESVDGYANVWRTTSTFYNPFDYYAAEVWFVNTDDSVTWSTQIGYSSSNNLSMVSGLSDDYQVCWIAESDDADYGNIYVYSEEDPTTRFARTEVPVRTAIISLNDQNYVAIENLTLRYSGERGVNENYYSSGLSGLKLSYCDIGYFGRKNGVSNMLGVNVRRSDMWIAHNEIHNCGRRGLSIVCYNTDTIQTIEDITVEHNYFHSGFNRTGMECNNLGSHTISNIVVRYNQFEDDPDVQLDDSTTKDIVEGDNESDFIYVSNQGLSDAYVGGMKIYGNIFIHTLGNSVELVSVDDVDVCNNTFYGFNTTLSSESAHIYAYSSSYDLTDLTIENNIFFNNRSADGSDPVIACVNWDEELEDELHVNYNLYYTSSGDSGWLLSVHDDADYSMSEWDDYLATYPALDKDSLTPADPLFVDPENGDFNLQSGSPAIHAGTPIDGITVDYNGYDYHTETPSLGALEWIE